MIATLTGRVQQKSADSVIIEVGGIGVEVVAPYSSIESISGEQAFLYTRLVVREDSLTLYGFATTAERELFDAVLKISGIGPKLAVGMLSVLTVDNIRNAVRNDKPEIISRVPGIGKKTAQKILLELQDKLPADLDSLPAPLEDDSATEVMDALTALGYSVVEAQAAVQSLPADAPPSIEERLLLALRNIGA